MNANILFTGFGMTVFTGFPQGYRNPDPRLRTDIFRFQDSWSVHILNGI